MIENHKTNDLTVGRATPITNSPSLVELMKQYPNGGVTVNGEETPIRITNPLMVDGITYDPNYKIPVRGFKSVVAEHKKNPIETIMPQQGTRDSAGYDFFVPHDVIVPAHSKLLFWTDVKAYMERGYVLMMFVRSSLGIKKGIQLANIVPIIDKDYESNPDNDGNIGICLYNTTDTDVYIKTGEAVAQGIFLPFGFSDNCNSDKVREGGIGSTSKS